MICVVIALAILGPATAPADAPKPIFKAHAETLFIDDPLALTRAGDRLAYLLTDGAGRVEVHLVTLPEGKPEGTFSVAAQIHSPEQLAFSADGRYLVVIGKQPEQERRDAQVFTLDGKAVGHHIGPATNLVVTQIEGRSAIVTHSVRTSGSGTTHEVAAFTLADGRPLGRRTLTSGKDGLVHVGEGFKIVYFQDDFLRVVGQKKGEYDKPNDVRRPDRVVVFDVLKGKSLEEHEIGDVVAWVREQKDRERHPNRAAFLQYSEDLKSLELITAEKRRALTPERPVWKYEPATLQQQLGDAPGHLFASLTVDPVNPEAVQIKKAEPDVFDLYDVDTAGPAMRRIWTGLRADKRALAWTAAGGRIAILHKHKGFDRGGIDLEVYDLQR
jgi:hypothetical protein